MTHSGGIKPVVNVRIYDLQNQSLIQAQQQNNNRKNKEESYENVPFNLTFANGIWKIEVLSAKLSGMVIDATINGEDVQFSPLMATRGPEITLWGDNAGIILR